MTLLPALSRQSLESSRITSRRLASIMRSSSAPRIVFAQFNTTPFSQVRSIYSDQVKLLSLDYGSHSLGPLLIYRSPISLSRLGIEWNATVNRTEGKVLVSRDIKTSELKEFSLAPEAKERGIRGLYFVLSM